MELMSAGTKEEETFRRVFSRAFLTCRLTAVRGGGERRKEDLVCNISVPLA